MTRQTALTAACLGMGLVAGSTQAAYVASDGQYFHWTAADGTSTIATVANSGADRIHFTGKSSNAVAITDETSGSDSYTRLDDASTSNYGYLTRSYSQAGPTGDFEYVTNIRFNLASLSSGSNAIIADELASSGYTWRLNAIYANATKYSLFLNYGQGSGGNPIRGWSQMSFNQWYDLSIYRLNASTYHVAVTDITTGTTWNQTIIDATSGGQIPSQALPASLRISTDWTSNSTNAALLIDKVLVGEVPEPASLSLLALGGLLVAGHRRK